MRKSLIPGMVAVLLLACPGAAQQAPQDILVLLAEAGGTDEYPDANTITVRNIVDIEYESSGAFELRTHELVKLLTIKGCKDSREAKFPYHRRYGSVEIPMARVIKSDGTIVRVDEDDITDGTMAMVARMNIFETDLRERVVTFPNLEPGDAIEYEMILRFTPLIKHHFSQEMRLQGGDPVEYVEVRITGPKKMPLHYKIYNGDIDYSFRAEGRKNHHRWVARDVEQILPETGMVSRSDVALKLAVSTDTSWASLSNYTWKRYGPKIKANRRIKAKVKELVDGIETRGQRIRAIQHYVSGTVRYLGVAMDRGAFIEPHKASYTFEKNYGVCRDVSVLTVAMLQEAGIPAEVVFVNPQKHTEPEIPTLSFMHAVVAIPEGSAYRYIDPTLIQNTAMVDDAHYISDMNVLHVVEGGADLRKVPHSSPEKSLGQTVARSVLDADGTLRSEVSILGIGFYDLILRLIASSANAGEMKLFWQEFLSGSLPGAELVAFETTDPSELDTAMRYDFSVQVEDHVLDAEKYLLMPNLLARTNLQILNLMFKNLSELPERIYPMQLGAPMGFEETETLVLPPGYTVRSLPDKVALTEGPFRMFAQYTPEMSDEGTVKSITYKRRLLVDDRILDPEEYRILKRIMRELERSTKGEIVLVRNAG
ncbi:MAG: DUF3857 domain-containing protein [Candidatus Eisenbacteria sp.]|nr:DUF3857 domain-containing protein [Candidatus Eisenbacteria bacterium]